MLWLVSPRAQTFFLSHCVGNASGTSEAIQLAERRALSPSTHVRQTSVSAPSNPTPVDQSRSSSMQPTLSTQHQHNEVICNSNSTQKKALQSEQPPSSLLVKRTSDSQMIGTTNGEEVRRRSSVSTEPTLPDRTHRKASSTAHSSTSTVTCSNKDSHTQVNKSTTTTGLAINENSSEKVVIIDTTAVRVARRRMSHSAQDQREKKETRTRLTFQIYDSINLGRRIDVIWPNEQMRLNGGRNVWSGWTPGVGMTGLVVHRWIPRHSDTRQRSHIDKCILLVHIDKYDKFVPIAEHGVRFTGESTYLWSNENTNELIPSLFLSLSAVLLLFSCDCSIKVANKQMNKYSDRRKYRVTPKNILLIQ